MGVFSKLKGIFYDEVDDDTEEETKEVDKVSRFVKKEPVIEREVPKIEEVKYKPIEVEEEKKEEEIKVEPKEEPTINERDLFRSERTFNFVDFSDDEEEEPVVSKRNVLSEENRTPSRVETPVKEVNDQNKAFKPTPVISPIWGVLNKDYKKDEIKEKTLPNDNLSSAVTSYDTVRRKAYGTLEDELEDTLNSVNNKVTAKEIKEEVKKVDQDVDLLEQKTQKIEDLISKIEDASNELDKTMSLSIGEIEDRAKEANYEEEEEEENVSDKTLTDSTLEHDLFNLIDSMYDDKEE